MKLRFFAKPLMAGVLAAGLLFSGCGGGGGSTAATKVTVSMSPGNGSTVNLFVNQTYQFTAQAVGSTDQSVTFALSYILASQASASPAPTPTPCVAAPTPSTNPNCGTIGAITPTSTTTTTNGTTITNTWYSVTYTAPGLVANPAVIIYLTATATADTTATAKATVNIDSGIRVMVTPATATIGTSEVFPFTATLTNDSIPNNVTWSLQQAGQVTTTAGTINVNGVYTAPATVPTSATVTVVATSTKDATRKGTATVTIVTAVPATFSGIAPAIGATPVVAPQGALFHDIYLLAGNLRSTSTVQITDGANVAVPVLAGQLKIISASLARLRLNAANLKTVQTLTISVVSATPPANPVVSQVSVVPVRPALIASIPDSATTGIQSNFQLNGGYFGPSAGPVVTSLFDGPLPQTITSNTPRQLFMTLAAGNFGADGPGLYQTSVVNGSATPSVAFTNIAAQPDPGLTPPSFIGTYGLGASAAPVAIAEDTTTGTAVVANSGNNTIQRITIGQGTLTVVDATGISVPAYSPATAITASPTNIAVDETQHIAAVTAVKAFVSVTEPDSRTVSIFNLGTGALLGTIDLTKVTPSTTTVPAPAPLAPMAVALDPDRKLGLVAFGSTSIGLIFNTDPLATPACLAGMGTTPYCVIGAVNISTGANPQIAFHPRLHWAFVTPGGAGQMSVVDMAEPKTNVGISSIKRVSNLVTVTTSASHNIDSGNLPSMLISGAADSSFNGTFTVTAVLDATTFTYAQVAADGTSTGGAVSYSRPLMTFSISPSIRGIAINPQTDRAVLTDGNNNFASFVSLLDQTTTGLSLHPATGAGYQSFTNVAVVVKPGPLGVNSNDLITLINPGTPGVFTAPPTQLAEITTGGTGSVAVAVDPPTNQALVVNTTSNNVSLIALGGAMKVPQISRVEIVDPLRRIFPQGTFYDPAAAAAPALSVKVFGAGFVAGTQARLDGNIPVGMSTTVDSSRQLSVTIPAAALTAPRRYALDVVQGAAYSNATDFTVVATVNIAGTGCLTPQPTGVAIDDIRDLAVVSNIGCNNVSVINLNTALIAATVPVGTAPAGVAMIPRLGYAVVTNSDLNLADGSSLGVGSVSIVNLATNAIIAGGSVNVGTAPTGVAINQDSGKAYITNTLSNTLSVIDLAAATPSAITVGVDQRPISIAVDPERNVALVGAIQQSGNSSQGVLDVMDIGVVNPTVRNRISAFTSMPAGIAFDPSDSATPGNNLFYAVSSLSNTLIMANPDTGGAQSVRIGMNPTSVAYNFQTGTAVTRNTASNTLSFVDMQSLRTRAVISLGAPPAPSTNVVLPQYAVAIHPRTNLAVVTDAAGGRVLLLPMPR
jgi:DNA-binding beta-propeller fold protein YncE